MVAIYIISLICIFFAISLTRRNVNIIECICLSVVYYYMSYVMITAALFMTFGFSLIRVTICNFVLWLCFAIIAWTKCKHRQTIQFNIDIKDSWLSYVIVLVLLMIFHGSFGFFGMNQDQGVYQTEAINFINNKNEWRQEIEEYNALDEGEYKSFYRDEVRRRLGYDLVQDGEEYVEAVGGSQATSELEGVFHGIPTFAAILAQSAKLFGVRHMGMIQALFYAVSLLLINIILMNLGISKGLRAGLVTLLGVSPEIIWIKKSSLTETFLTVLILAYLYYLLNDEDYRRIWSILPVIVFSFYHVTIFTMLPLFILNYVFLYFSKSEQKYIWCGIVSVIFYEIGFGMMVTIQPRYTLINYHIALSFVKVRYIPYLALGAGAVAILLLICLLKVGKIKINWDKAAQNSFVVISASCSLYLLYWYIKHNNEMAPWSSLTIFSYAVLTACVCVPYILIKLLSKKYEATTNVIVLGNVFIYAIIIYSTIMRKQITYYYYYGRYIAPYLSAVIILYALFVRDAKARTKRINSILLTTGILVLLPFLNVIRTHNDDTIMEWKNVDEVLKNVTEGDIILIDSDLVDTMYHPLRSKGAKVYPVKEDYQKTILYANLDSYSDHLYYLTDNINVDNDELNIIYANRNYYSEDDINHSSNILKLPTEFAQCGENKVYFYHIVPKCTQLNVAQDNYNIEGFGDIGESEHRWIYKNTASIYPNLEKSNYCMRIFFGDAIPFDFIAQKTIMVDVYLNDIFVENFELDKDNLTEEQISLSETDVMNGINKITFKMNQMWSPSEYGSSDINEYGFSMGTFIFEKQSTN